MYASTAEAPILVIGSAHVVDLALPLRRALENRMLDGLAVELDADRAAVLLAPEGSSQHVSQGGPLFIRIWGFVQRRLGAELGGGLAGGEMRVAAQVANDRKIPLFLVDDPIRETVARLLGSLSLKERVGLFVGSFLGLFAPRSVVARQIDHYAEAPQDYLSALREAYPTVARVLVDDRNDHMAGRLAAIRQKGYGRLAVVVGDAHVEGLARALRHLGVLTETLPFSRLRAITASPASPS